MNETNFKAAFNWENYLLSIECTGCGKTVFSLPKRPGCVHAMYCRSCGEVTLVRIDTTGGFLSHPVGKDNRPAPIILAPVSKSVSDGQNRVEWRNLVFEIDCLNCGYSTFSITYEPSKTSGITCSSCGTVSCLKVLADGSLVALPIPVKSSAGKILAEAIRMPGASGMSLWGLAITKGLERMITNSIGMKLRLIFPGEFMMGFEGGSDSEKNVHHVTLTKPFYIGIYPVTQKQFETVMGGNPSYFKGDDRPVEQVSWEHAVEFCKFLSEREGAYYRLPTEAEWEYACRAGTTTEYYWGDTMDSEFCWYKENSDGKTKPVGLLRPNGWGLYDMLGNVWEWCLDRYGDYPKERQVDPTGPKSGENYVIRGGSWNQFAQQCRSSHRNGSNPKKGTNTIGFRVVMIPKLPDITGERVLKKL